MSSSLRSTPEALQKFCKFLENQNRKFILQEVKNGGLTREDVIRYISRSRDIYNDRHATETYWDHFGYDDDFGPSSRIVYAKYIYPDDIEKLTDNYIQSVKQNV